MVDEAEQSESEESSEYEEYSDSEDETGPRLKPVFVRKYDTLSIIIIIHMIDSIMLLQDGSSDNPRERGDRE